MTVDRDRPTSGAHKLTTFLKQTWTLMCEPPNFPVPDPGYRIDHEEATAAERRDAIDPAHARPVERLRIPL